MSDTLTGRTIGKYQILEKLGRGGMAEVYKAYQENLDRYVAIKLMHAFLVSEQDFLQRFKREARAMAAMNHPNIVGVYDFDVYKENVYYLVMEYIAGGTLKQRLEQLAEAEKSMPMEKSVQIGYQVAEALDYAHQRDMVHRDVKPANIMLGEDDRALLTDFGIVKMIGGQTMAYTVTGALIGTPSYMAPEQAMGEPGDNRVDIYALGVLLFQMTTGQLPYTADTPLAVIMKHVNEPAPEPVTFNPDVPVALQDIILKAMAKDPEERYQTAGQMAQDLRNVQLGDSAKTGVFMAAVPPMDALTPDAVDLPAAAPEDRTEAMTAASATAVATGIHDSTPTFQSMPLPGQMKPAAPPPPIPESKKRSPWLYVGLALLVLILLGGTAVAFSLFGGGDSDETDAAVADVTTSTSQPTNTPQPGETPDTNATVSAAIALTEESSPTETATATDAPTETPTTISTATPTPTIDATAAFLEACLPGVTLVNTYTYQNEQFDAAPTGSQFPVNWVLENSGTCPWPETLEWTFVSGETFGYDADPIPVPSLNSGEQATITADFAAPNLADRYDSTWQLVDSATGESFGAPLEFDLATYVPATPTLVPTNTPAASPTPAATVTAEQPLDLIYVINDCEYIGSEYRCQVQITPYGGGGGPYTVFVFDADQPAEYRGTFPTYHFAKARRCALYNNEIVAIDDATGTRVSKQLFIDPNDYISGGCVLP